MDIPTIDTPHLTLRAWAPRDADVWHDILQEEAILRYFPNPDPPSRPKADEYIAHHLEHWRAFGYGHWAIVTPDDAQVIGWCGLEYLPELQQTELAYLLSKRAWGRGYATEAARAALDFGFGRAGLTTIIGLVHPANTGSIRVLEKCGLTFSDQLTLWGLAMLRYRRQV